MFFGSSEFPSSLDSVVVTICAIIYLTRFLFVCLFVCCFWIINPASTAEGSTTARDLSSLGTDATTIALTSDSGYIVYYTVTHFSLRESQTPQAMCIRGNMLFISILTARNSETNRYGVLEF